MRSALVFVLLAFSLAVAQSQGATIYQARCAVCHGSQGQGTPGLYPPLAGTLGRLLALEEARAYIAWVVRYGLSGFIRSSGGVYNGVMPAHPGLSAEELTDLLNFLVTLSSKQLPPNFRPFSLEEVRQYQAQPKTPGELRKLREAILEKLTAKGLPPP